MGVNLVDECNRLLYCFVIVGNISIHLPSPFSKTGRLGRFLIVRLNLSAKTAPKEVFLEKCLMLLLFKKF